MNKAKKYKKQVRTLFTAGKLEIFHTYEIDYDHTFVALGNSVVYDCNDRRVYRFQTGGIP